MSLLRRVPAILPRPWRTWPSIAEEPAGSAAADAARVAVLAAIPAVALFVGLCGVGVRTHGTNLRWSVAAGLAEAAITYVTALLLVALLVLVADALAPLFDGKRDRGAALKLVAHASTGAFVGGVFAAVPAIAVVGVAGLLYAVYRFHAGVPALMRCPPRNAAAYTSAVAVSGIAVVAVVAALLAHFNPLVGSSIESTQHEAPPPIAFDRSTIPVIVARMEDTSRRVAAAQSSTQPALPGPAASAASGLAAGSTVVGPSTPRVAAGASPIPARELRASLPETLAGMPRDSIDAGEAMSSAALLAWAKASYLKEGRHIAVSIVDLGGPVVIAAMRNLPYAALRNDNADAVEHTYNDGARAIREVASKDARPSKLTVVLANGVMIELSAARVGVSFLKVAYAAMDVRRLEALKRSTRR